MILIAVLLGFTALILHIFRHNRKPKNFPPGPLSLPIIGSALALGIQPHKSLMKLKKTYGSVIGIDFASFRGVVVADVDSIKESFGHPALNNRPPFEILSAIRGRGNGDYIKGITWSSGKDNAEKRKFVIKSLANFGVGKRSIEKLFMGNLDQTFQRLDTKLGQPLINKHLFNITTVNSLWTIMTGQSYREDDAEFNKICESINRFIAAMCSAGGVMFSPTISKLMPNLSGWNEIVEVSKQHDDFVRKVIQDHQIPKSKEPSDFIEDYLQKVQTTTNPNSCFFGELGNENIVSTVSDLLTAGMETVSTTISWFILAMVLNPDAQEKLYKEIRSVIGERKVELDDRKMLPYAEAVVLECLRWGCSVPLAAPHWASEDFELNGYLIPKGTVVVPNIYGVLHDENLWEKPETFSPERFIADDGSILRDTPINYAFGYGKKGCPGEVLAKDELFLFVVAICQRYVLSVTPGEAKPTWCASIGLSLVPKPHSFVINLR